MERRTHRDPKTLVQQGATLLDVRTPEEFAQGHLPDALNIPVHMLSSRLDEIEGPSVVVYCRSGARSAVAAQQLRGAGYQVLDIGSMANY